MEDGKKEEKRNNKKRKRKKKNKNWKKYSMTSPTLDHHFDKQSSNVRLPKTGKCATVSPFLARVNAVPVSMPLSLLSPIHKDNIWAPGAKPLRSTSSGKQAAAMLATWRKNDYGPKQWSQSEPVDEHTFVQS
uniref:Uncharacterized protein n=1 Tax=Romanomermis culicivorax TaxID=13658 RepID=A0A915K4C8_ROMCU